MIGKSVCMMHGGKSPRGVDSPHTTHGRYSRDLPARLLATYETGRNDPELLSLRAEIAALDARIVEVLGRVDQGEAGTLFTAARTAFANFQQVTEQGTEGAIADAVSELGDLLARGAADYAAWADVRTMFQERRKLVESERRRSMQLGQLIPVAQALLCAQMLTESVRRNVTDPQVLASIRDDIGRLIGEGQAGQT